MPRVFFVLLCAASLTVSACSSEVPEKPATPTPPPGKSVDAATAGAVTGKVVFEGAVPPAAILRMSADPKCVQGAGPNPQSDALLVGAEGAVKNAFVYVKDGLDPEYAFETPTTPVVLDQKGCIYTPRVLGARVGQPVEIVNSDPTLHNVHALPMVNREFNHGQPRQFLRASEVFTAPEVMVRFKCDVHAWMAAWVGVLPHPYFAVSDTSGAFALPNLPPGSYTIEAWHEKLGTRTTQVTIGPSQTQSVSLSFTAPTK